jgi:non-specific serine/threonine protein kinase
MAATRAAGAGRLPAQQDAFVGRAVELGHVDVLLQDAPLLTLTGPGGVGKTRLALRVAQAAADRYPDGTFLAELSALRDPGLLAHTISRQLGLAEQAAGSQRELLLGHLRERCLLLILDTCEHLIDACADLAEAIEADAPLVTVLATSREPLAVAGETVYQVGPLPVGEVAGDAVELFTRRAAVAAPGFALTAANRVQVSAICRGLDGVPLAIELAAGRLRDLSLDEVSARLSRRLTLLTGGSDGDGGRHATARNVIAWSYDTCTSAERALWARLSVFPGGFDVDAAAELGASGALDRAAVFETIIGLVNKSLLVPLEPAAGAEGTRPEFRLLDTVREFGAERLAESGQEAETRARFLVRYLGLARQADALAFGDGQLDRFAGLHREHASVRAALAYALDPVPAGEGPVRDGASGATGTDGRQRDGAELATRLWAYWLSSGLLSEGLYWLGKALDRVPASCPQRAWVHVARCLLGAVHGSIDRAVADGRAAVALAETLKRPQIAGRGNAALCLASLLAGDLESAARAGKAAERQLTSAGDTDGLIVLDAHLAALDQASGQPGRGIGVYQRGIGRFGDGSTERMYHGYLHLSGALCYLELPGREAECARVLSLALTAKYDLEEVTGTAYGLELLGWLAAGAGRFERTAWLLGAADPLWAAVGARLSNAAPWERRHAAAVAAAAGALGPDGYAALFAAGGSCPRDQVVALAINDADSLGGPRPGQRPGAGRLTEREREVAFLAAAGLTVTQVAGRLFLPPAAVEEDLASVFGKLGVSSAAQLGPWLGEPA